MKTTFYQRALALCALLAATTATPRENSPAMAAPYDIVAYYPGWKSAAFPVQQTIDARQVGVVLYAFADTCSKGRHGNPDPSAGIVAACRDPLGSNAMPADGALVLVDPAVDGANLRALAALKKVNPALRILVSVGGWNWSNQFSNIAASTTETATFAASALALMRRYHLDGIDIDWEYPTLSGVPCTAGQTCARPEDKQNYVLLTARLRRAFDDAGRADGKHYAITIAAGATGQFINDGESRDRESRDGEGRDGAGRDGKRSWLARLADNLDWINLMAYDYHMPWDARNGNLAALYGDPADPAHANGYDDDRAIQHYLDAGVAPSRLVLGMPFYGYGWKGCPPGPGGDGLYQSCGGAAGTGLDGSASYPFAHLVQQGYLKAGPDGRYDQAGRGYVRRWNAVAKTPSLYDPVSATFISYEDEASLLEKARYVKSRGLRGAMYWEATADLDHVLARTLAGALAAEKLNDAEK
jgi:chitinase